MILLEDETKGIATQRGETVTIELGDILSRKTIDALRRPVDQADDVHQRRLAGPGGADDGHELAGIDRQLDAAQRASNDIAAAIGAADAR